jgi:LuxR family quorum sensing-dependent transcriptional regulator
MQIDIWNLYGVIDNTKPSTASSEMTSIVHRNLIFETIDNISRLNLLSQVAVAFSHAAARFGFTSLGINGLPPPGEGADPLVVTESVPEGFRDCYIQERFYLVDHICTHARAAYEPFQYSDAPYDRTHAPDHERFMQALDTFGMSRGLIVPIGRPANIPACVWLAGENPDLDDGAKQAMQLIALFAASKSRALSRPPTIGRPQSRLTPREREVLQWISAGKTSWEISTILGLSERAINKIIGDAMIKLDGVTRTQAVVNAIRLGEIEL